MIGLIPLRFWVLIGFGLGFVFSGVGRAQEVRPDPGSSRGYLLVPQSAKRIKANLTIQVKAPNVTADEWSVYVSQLPELPGQVEVKTTLFPTGKPARDLGDENRPILFAKLPSLGEQFRREVKARVEYEATLIERRLERREEGDPEPPPPAPLDPRARRLYVSSGHQFDFNSPRFRAWLQEKELRRDPNENEIDFARKVFLAVRQGFTYNEGEDIEHLASKVCEVGKSDDGGLTAVFVAAMRANGIPTRVLAGRMVQFNGQPIRNTSPHTRTEFYTRTLGWVPADPAGAIRSGRKTEGLEYFGNDNAELITHHIDSDLIVDTYFGAKTHEWLQNPAWWVIGGGNFDGSTTKIDVTVEVEPLDLAAVLARINDRPATKNASTSTKKSATKTKKAR